MGKRKTRVMTFEIMKNRPQILCIYGAQNSGKTYMITRLIKILTRQHYKVVTIKHVHHKNFTIDTPGKDSFAHKRAGANIVVVSAKNETSYILDREQSLEEIIRTIELIKLPDVILAEGFKQANFKKIRVGNTKLLPNTIITVPHFRWRKTKKYMRAIKRIVEYINEKNRNIY